MLNNIARVSLYAANAGSRAVISHLATSNLPTMFVRHQSRPTSSCARVRTWTVAAFVVVCVLTIGCGTTREKLATEQLLLSDAVDRAVAQVDFKPLSGETVFLDSSYVRQIKPTSLVSADYVISALRQQMVIAGCLLQDNREEATY
ncbi:MAG: hypothetical protein KDB23_33295, partial [Planctomycetales bacterium]|nr:hypothetical protein [Planctomycetales bacterium]